MRLDLSLTDDVPPATREALVRIVREAVSNATRHGNAGEIAIQLRRDEDGVHLRIDDDGRGFDAGGTSDARGFGIVSMKERAQLLGGQLKVCSRPGEGTTVEVICP